MIAARLSSLIIALALTLQTAFAKDGGLEQSIKAAFDAEKLDGLHSVVVLRKGAVFAELYFPGEDERWGQATGNRTHGPETLHDLRSVTKSIVSLLYGIALADGIVPPLDAPVIDSFPQYPDLQADPERKAIRIRDVLSMRMGTAWNEELPYTDPNNSEIAMEFAPDRYRFILGTPIVNKPDDWWNYNGGAPALIAKIISDAAGKPIDAYAQEKLFAPLGIAQFEWVRGKDGEPSAASGLRMTARGLAKIGQMVHDKGAYGGAQVVPAAWIEDSLTSRSKLATGMRYGFFWWIAPMGDPPPFVMGSGNGGQRLALNAGPSKLVTVVFAGNYNDRSAYDIPDKVIGLIFDALKK